MTLFNVCLHQNVFFAVTVRFHCIGGPCGELQLYIMAQKIVLCPIVICSDISTVAHRLVIETSPS